MAGLAWWEWWRARRRLDTWVRAVIGPRPYRALFRTGEGSYCDFARRLVVVEPTLPDRWGPEARRVPTTWGGAPVTEGRQLQVLAARAIAAHEAGHVLFTTPGVAAPGVHHTLTNILEDERMERLVARHAVGRQTPSAATDLAELGRRFWLDGFPAVPDRKVCLLNAALYHRWDSDRPRRALSRLVLPDPDERRAWEERIRPLVEEAWQAPDTERVAALALAILAIIGLPPETPETRLPGLLAGVDGGPHGDRAPGEEPLPGGTADPASGAGSGDPDDPDDRGRPGGGRDPDLDDPLLATGAADDDPSDGILWMQPSQALERQVAGDIGRLQAELRVRVPEADDEPNRARGHLDARAAVRTRGERPLVRPALDGDGPTGLAVLLLIDGTGSMGGSPGAVGPDNRPLHPARFDDPSERMPHVRAAAMLVQRACAGLGIPLAIAEACAAWGRCHQVEGSSGERSPVTWLQRFETDPEAEGPRALIAGLYGHAMREEVCRSLAIAAPRLAERREETKLLLYVHDGQPNDRPEAIRAALARLRGGGLVVLGLYVGPQEGRDALSAIFDPEWTIAAAHPGDLPALLGRVLRRYRQGG
jgi:hypothetical protein